MATSTLIVTRPADRDKRLDQPEKCRFLELRMLTASGALLWARSGRCSMVFGRGSHKWLAEAEVRAPRIQSFEVCLLRSEMAKV